VAITLDASSSGSAAAAAAVNWNHTGAGAPVNFGAIVRVILRSSAVSVTGITYNGVAMTFFNRRVAGGMAVELWYLADPAVGVQAVAVSLDGATDVVGVCTTFEHISQTTPMTVGVGGGTNGNTNLPNLTLLNTTGQMMVLSAMACDLLGAGDPVATVTPPAIQDAQVEVGDLLGCASHADGVDPATGMAWTLSNATTVCLGAWAALSDEVLFGGSTAASSDATGTLTNQPTFWGETAATAAPTGNLSTVVVLGARDVAVFHSDQPYEEAEFSHDN
jgi:hypothetical protein